MGFRAAIPKELHGHDQKLACEVVAKLGYPKAATRLRVARTTIWTWAHGKNSPTEAKYRDLQELHNELYKQATP